ncbi:hypothetical protein C7121_23875 [Paenibacillus glucanolyticus]|jgi:hypothetical protein|uniref:hypothetical protein n=1 Tax=Paenibacillus TaxID=44249 RepID=UPI0003E1CB3B|nr:MULTISPECIES: hypothetical protein [Paenibacillus]ANA82324.1 hypothetical protein A3958_21140 [Paenibacillus glucanolyticus]AVV58938.1 hypothetical protein C7121_23875 [Paenibacillus glucanolyticus]ETT39571.1 hypothetical protein C169_09928 [Paenibacillus sp. FSL R5-808]MPY17095.1 hypothetical protein [Paenibacillus glucanolyticus]
MSNQSQELKVTFKQLAFNTVITVFITSIVSTSLSYLIWIWQFNKTTEEKIWDRKFEIFTKLSDNLAEQQTLLSAKLKIKFELHSRTNGKPFTSIEEKRKINDELKENLPYEYDGLIAYDENLIKLYSSFFIAETTFGDSTDRAIAEYLHNIVNKDPQEFIDSYLKKMNKTNVTINIQELVDDIYIDANIYRQSLLEQMKNELGL